MKISRNQAADDGGTFKGKLSITNLAYDTAKGLVASGVIKGTETNSEGVTQAVKQTFNGIQANLKGSQNSMASKNLAVQQTSQTGCQLLYLDLGPLHLNLLGLNLNLSEIVLNLTALPGPGNLLGKLLYSVAGLLDGNGFLNSITGTLTNLMGLLNQLNQLIG